MFPTFSLFTSFITIIEIESTWIWILERSETLTLLRLRDKEDGGLTLKICVPVMISYYYLLYRDMFFVTRAVYHLILILQIRELKKFGIYTMYTHFQSYVGTYLINFNKLRPQLLYSNHISKHFTNFILDL